jgi:hypothetical protein
MEFTQPPSLPHPVLQPLRSVLEPHKMHPRSGWQQPGRVRVLLRAGGEPVRDGTASKRELLAQVGAAVRATPARAKKAVEAAAAAIKAEAEAAKNAKVEQGSAQQQGKKKGSSRRRR